MRTPIEHLCFQLENTFEGKPWYGRSLMDILREIAPDTAHQVLRGRSILRLGRHLLAWRVFTLEKLRGNAEYDIEIGGEGDWPSDPGMDWPALLDALRDNQAQLLAALRQFPEANLLERVPGRNFRYSFLLEGVVQHDIYHLGQIALLKQLL